MTPTEQDKELRDKVATIVEYWDFSPLQDEDNRIERLQNEIMQLITADRKRVALEARIDELHIEADRFRQAGHKGLPPNFQPRMNKLQRELKAQQEEVK